jgi:Kinesin motor domain
MYGMTGAGKTFTMFGDVTNYLSMNSSVPGIIMLALREIMRNAGLTNTPEPETDSENPNGSREASSEAEVKA